MNDTRLRRALPLAFLLTGLPLASSAQEETPAPEEVPAQKEASAAASPEELSTIPVSPEEASLEPPEAASSVRNRSIEEIVVTAQKREENIQDVPISIQAFSGDALAARGIEDTTQLGQSVPSLQFTSIAGFQLIYIRGLGTDNFIPSADPSVATYVDGIYVPVGQGATQSLGNVRRVEVLKGPQGTLFGRNATGGAISIVTEEPGDEFKGSMEVQAGNFNDRAVKANVSAPVTDWLSVGLSGAYSDQEFYYSNINFDTKPSTLKAGRVKLNFGFTDDLSLALTAAITRQETLGTQIGKNVAPSLLGRAAGIQAQPDNYQSDTDFPASGASKQDLYYGTLSWSLPRFDIKLLGSHQRNFADPNIDFDGSRLPIATFSTPYRNMAKLETAELQFVSNDDSWSSDVFKWTTGLYYFHSNTGYDPVYLSLASGGLNSALDIAGVTLPDGLTDAIGTLSALLPNSPVGDQGLSIAFSGLIETDSYSGYAQGTYYFTDWADLTLGGRYQEEKRFLTKATVGVLNPFDESVIPGYEFGLPSATARNFSPKAVLSFHPSEDDLVYLSYSVGFKSGTFNIVNIYTPPNFIEPEEVTTYELGAKMSFFDGLLRVNGAVFYNDIDNLQTGFVSLLAGGAVRFLTVPAAKTQGAELDGTWLPMPDLNPGLAFNGNVAYVDAKYSDFKEGNGFNEDTGIYEQNQDYSGNKIVRTPKLSGGLGVVQAVEISGGSIEIGVDGYYNSGFFYDASNNIEEDPYSILNGRVSFLHERSNVRVTAYGKNLLDRRYHLAQFETDFGLINTLAPPKEFGLRFNWDF